MEWRIISLLENQRQNRDRIEFSMLVTIFCWLCCTEINKKRRKFFRASPVRHERANTKTCKSLFALLLCFANILDPHESFKMAKLL